MEKQAHVRSGASQSIASREELEQHLRARAWKDDAFRQEFLANPKAVLERDYAQYFPKKEIPSELSIKVIEEEEQTICLVIPSKLPDDQISDFEPIDDQDLLFVKGMLGNSTSTNNQAGNTCSTCSTCNQCKSVERLKSYRL